MNQLKLQLNSYYHHEIIQGIKQLDRNKYDEVLVEFPNAHDLVSEDEMKHLVGLCYHSYEWTLTKTEEGFQLSLKRKE